MQNHLNRAIVGISNLENILGLPQEQADKLPNCDDHAQFKVIHVCLFGCEGRILYCKECSKKKIPGTEINVHAHAPVYIHDACAQIAYSSQQAKEKAEELVSKANEFFDRYKIVLECLDRKLIGQGEDNFFNPQNYNSSMMTDFKELTKLLEKIKQTNDYIEKKSIELKIIDVINKKQLVESYKEEVDRYGYLDKISFNEVWSHYNSLFFQDEQLNLNLNDLDADNYKLLTFLREKVSNQKMEWLEEKCDRQAERITRLEQLLKTKFDQLNTLLETQLGVDRID
ncbi:UNKNOWN [Stylonychia lemnae]|uniref:Uncharacterized protein n=1 Tax=Stylonychia lemnae TaxID=5949 RepID=A0A078A0T7_STYLE|nr:UNKNOWN [Stylonychia lemnae]|eukprot:CDW75750.1 UNKNOWN [Stylonychia lemnae]